MSADTTQGVKDFVENHQLSPYIDFIMGVDGGLSKPDPRLYLQTCQQLGVNPLNTLMVGDSQGDIAMAKKCPSRRRYWYLLEISPRNPLKYC